jgi:hypothetical protein
MESTGPLPSASSAPDRCYVCGCTSGDRCRVHGLECVLLADGACSACESIEDTVAQAPGRDWLIRLLVETMSERQPTKPLPFVPCSVERASLAKLEERLRRPPTSDFRPPASDDEKTHNEIPAALAGGGAGAP